MFDLINGLNSVNLRKEVTENYLNGLRLLAQARVNKVHQEMDFQELSKLLKEFK